MREARGPIRQETTEGTITRLERQVQRFERRYEISSDEMVYAVKVGSMKETAEIGQWLGTYSRLKEFQNRVQQRGAGQCGQKESRKRGRGEWWRDERR